MTTTPLDSRGGVDIYAEARKQSRSALGTRYNHVDFYPLPEQHSRLITEAPVFALKLLYLYQDSPMAFNHEFDLQADKLECELTVHLNALSLIGAEDSLVQDSLRQTFARAVDEDGPLTREDFDDRERVLLAELAAKDAFCMAMQRVMPDSAGSPL